VHFFARIDVQQKKGRIRANKRYVDRRVAGKNRPIPSFADVMFVPVKSTEVLSAVPGVATERAFLGTALHTPVTLGPDHQYPRGVGCESARLRPRDITDPALTGQNISTIKR
jgi:hypothetical protein